MFLVFLLTYNVLNDSTALQPRIQPGVGCCVEPSCLRGPFNLEHFHSLSVSYNMDIFKECSLSLVHFVSGKFPILCLRVPGDQVEVARSGCWLDAAVSFTACHI